MFLMLIENDVISCWVCLRLGAPFNGQVEIFIHVNPHA